ncbi:MAG TPA: hypothetical protein VFR02_08290 [bacterium]|nr:hypothetical protein [bacterium]
MESALTAPPTPAQPEGTAPSPARTGPLSLGDKARAAADAAKKAPEPAKPKGESAPPAPAQDAPPEGAQEDESNATPEGEVDKVTWNGKEASLQDILEDGTFEIFANGKTHSVEGFQKLADLASMGLDSANRNRLAKEGLVKAQDIVRELEGERDKAVKALKDVDGQVDSKVNAILDVLYKNVSKGFNADGTRFETNEDQQKALAQVRAMKTAFAGTPENPGPVSAADIEKMVQERLDKRFAEESGKQDQARQEAENNRLISDVGQRLTEATKSDGAYFTKPDGKLNSTLFSTYKRELISRCQEEWNAQGQPRDLESISQVIREVRSLLIEDLKISDPGRKPEPKPAPPVLKPASGAGTPRSDKESRPHFRSPAEAMRYYADQAKKRLASGG